ncbi:MAG: GGDEF domain-containing protein [Gammaproteobacteria bacterium]|nr:GGDEF domain-containing protein [Gammaproteobacteria bacterium]
MKLAEANVIAPDLGVLVQSDKLQLLYRLSSPAALFSLFNAALLTVILWSAQDHSILLAWFSVLLISTVLRLFLFHSYRKAAPLGEDVLAWEKPYFMTLILSSLVWGIGSVLIMPADSAMLQTVVFCFLIGMSGGAISVYSVHREMTLATVAAMLLPVTACFFISEEFAFTGLAIAAIVFYVSAIRATRVLGLAIHQNFLMTHQLEISRQEAERLARVDELTGLYNRRAFYEYGKVLANNSQRTKDELAMVLMDIDHFKTINDSYGHAAGDSTLKQIGHILLQRLRKSDVFARIGGEEFGMLLPATSLEKAAQLAEELRRVIEKCTVFYGDQEFHVTASFGVCSGVSDIDRLVRQADIAMYRSKQSGRNTVVCDEQKQ